MALMKCPECGNMVSDKATECPQCGAPITLKYNKHHRIHNKWLFAIICVFAVFAVGIIVYLLVKPTITSRHRSVPNWAIGTWYYVVANNSGPREEYYYIRSDNTMEWINPYDIDNYSVYDYIYNGSTITWKDENGRAESLYLNPDKKVLYFSSKDGKEFSYDLRKVPFSEYQDRKGNATPLYYQGHFNGNNDGPTSRNISSENNESTSSAYSDVSKHSEYSNNYDWIQGSWKVDLNGELCCLKINGNNIKSVMGEETSFDGTYSIIENQTYYNNGKEVHYDAVILEDGGYGIYPLDKNSKRIEAGGGYYYSKTNIESNNQSPHYHSSSSSSDYTSFRTSDDVIFYLSGKTFINDDGVTLRIAYDGIFIDGEQALTSAPYVERVDTYKALLRVNVIPAGELSMIIDPIGNKIIDNSGDVYRLSN